ncbi:hypothetical protein BBJ28_00025481 [Nothophytophthora sp. Chile5]|nr:hypothetical protein BBJ28_00025481 [Nothophytophthora sp. Chile5]
MMGHQTKLFQSRDGRRLMVSDNFYTRHLLAKALLKFTDGEVRTLGTVRLNLVDKWNKVKLTEATKRVEGMDRGSWELVAAVDAEVGWKRKQDEHKKAQKHLPKEQQTPYNATVAISPRAGYIVLKDKRVPGTIIELLRVATDCILYEGGRETR